MIHENFVWLGLLFGVVGGASYLIATIKGTVKPNRLSWFILSVAPMVAFAAELQEGVGLRSLMTFWVGFSPFIVFCASFVNKNAYWKLSRFDLGCAALAIVALVLWASTGSGNLAIALSICADGFALLPIVVKAWTHPHTESPWLFLGGVGNAGIALLVLDRYTFADLAFPLYILLGCAWLLVTILVRQKMVSATAEGG